MSGFFGIFNPKGTGIDLEVFQQIKNAADRPGHDGIEIYADDHIALGHIMLRVSPESKHDQQPLKSNCGNYILVGHFRLDYRDELGDKLGLTQTELELTPDSRLVMLAYQKWKDKCAEYLEGDWAFAINDISENRLFLFKNTLGISSLFYFEREGNVFFGTDTSFLLSPKSLAFELDNSEVLSLSTPNYYPLKNKTIIKGLCFLDNAECFCFGSDFKKYYSLKADSRPQKINYRNDAEYFHDFLLSYYLAVKSRINGQISNGLLLSGGLDSTSIACLGALELELSKNMIYAFTSVPLDKKSPKYFGSNMIDESPLVEELAKKYTNIECKFYDFPHPDLRDDTNLFIYKNAYHPILNKNSFWLNGIFNECKKAKIHSLLIGQSGNYSVSWSGTNYYLFLIINFKILSIFRYIISEFYYSKNLYSTLKVILYVPGIYFFENIYNSLYQTLVFRKNRFFKLTGFLSLSIVFSNAKDFFRVIYNAFRNYESQKKAMQSSFFSFVSNKLYIISSRKYLQVSDPTMDLRLVNYLNNIPQVLFFKKHKRKFLFRMTFSQLLPENIINRTQAQIQSADFDRRFKEYFNTEMIEFQNKNDEYHRCLKFGEIQAFYKTRSNSLEFNNQLNAINQFIKAISIQEFCNSLKK